MARTGERITESRILELLVRPLKLPDAALAVPVGLAWLVGAVFLSVSGCVVLAPILAVAEEPFPAVAQYLQVVLEYALRSWIILIGPSLTLVAFLCWGCGAPRRSARGRAFGSMIALSFVPVLAYCLVWGALVTASIAFTEPMGLFAINDNGLPTWMRCVRAYVAGSFWWPVGLVALWLMLVAESARRLDLALALHCRACGYDLNGLPTRHCPECGHEPERRLVDP